ncbi:MAG: glucose-1-phosphate adenylyltransferase [bacterium]|nr:glucose-1-phosphate adenylyltransferase [bacterium]
MSDYSIGQTAVLILGGGQGTRLYPLTKSRSKPAVPVAGKYRLIDISISNCLHSRLDRLYILTQFNSDSLHRHIAQTYRFDMFSKGFIQILAAQQTPKNRHWYQGTADAVRQSLERLHQRQPENVLILSGDHLYRMDYRNLLRVHTETNADVTISVFPVDRPRCKDFGIMKINDKEEIVNFVEKPSTPEEIEPLRVPGETFQKYKIEPKGREFIASMGIYAFKTRTLFEALSEHDGSDFGKNIIPAMIKNKNVHAYFFDGYWEDIGTIASFYEASLSLTRPVPDFNFYDEDFMIHTRPRFLPGAKINDAQVRSAIICDGAIISAGATVERTIVGLRGVIGEGAYVADTVYMGADYYDGPNNAFEDVPTGAPPLGIGAGTIIKGAIVDKNARIGRNCRISNEGKSGDVDQTNFSVRDGIVVIPRSAVIPDGTVI